MTLEERIQALSLAESSGAGRALFLQLIDDPDEGDVFFINTCVMTYDPRKDERSEIIGAVPFLLWPKQEDASRAFGRAMDNSYDIGGEKSRDVGFTWIVLACLVRRWLRVRHFSALIGHYVDTLLDSDDDSSLFWRIDWILKHLPPFMLPQGFDLESKDWRAFGKLLNPAMTTQITGAAPTARFGVGARKSVIYFDDWARWEFGAQAYKSASAVTDCRITTWTVNPDDPMNHAYELRFGKGEDFKDTSTVIVSCTWKDDPRKMRMGRNTDGTLYNIWLRRMLGDRSLGIPGRISQETFDREYNMLYEIAMVGQIYAQQLPYVRRGDFPYDPRFPLYTVVDPGVSDDCVILWIQWDWEMFRYRIVDAYKNSGFGAAFYIPIIHGRRMQKGEVLAHEKDYSEYDNAVIRRHTGWQQLDRPTGIWQVEYAGHFGDPAARNRGAGDGKSFRDVLAGGWDGQGEGAIHLRFNDLGNDFRSRIEASRTILQYTDVNEECADYVISMLRGYRWPKTTNGTIAAAPVHDKHSHLASAYQYYAVNDPHKDEFNNRAMSMSRTRAEAGMSIFGDLSALPESVQKEILRGQAGLDGLTKLKVRNADMRENKDVYSPKRSSGGGYGVVRRR